MEEKISFFSGGLQIEGLFNKNNSDKGAVITHPHPLYGGSMYDFVVESIANAFWQKGYATLKFNFRGVGKSQGDYDNGIGEQTDVCAAVSYLADLNLKQIDLAGYSFGAWVNARINPDAAGVQDLILVSPPVDFLDFQGINPILSLKLVVTGSSDGFAPPAMIQKMLDQWGSSADLEVIQGADHFYDGYHVKLETIISSYL